MQKYRKHQGYPQIRFARSRSHLACHRADYIRARIPDGTRDKGERARVVFSRVAHSPAHATGYLEVSAACGRRAPGGDDLWIPVAGVRRAAVSTRAAGRGGK